MSTKTILVAIALLTLLTSVTSATVINSTWVVCDNGFWSDVNNWNPKVVPDNNGSSSYSVTIDTRNCAEEVEVRIRQNRTINDLTVYGDVDLEGYVYEDITDIVLAIVEDLDVTLTLENNLTNYGELEIQTLGIDGNLSNHAHMELEEVDMVGSITNYGYMEIAETDIEGTLTNTSGAKLEFQSLGGAEVNGYLYNLQGGFVNVESEAEIKQGDIENAGTITLYPLGQMMFENHLNNTGEILPKGGSLLYWAEESGPGIFDNNTTGTIKGFGLLTTQTLNNKGAIYAYGGSLAIINEGPLLNTGVLGNYPLSSLHIKPATDVNNNGSIIAHAGGGVAFDCNLVNETNGIIKLLGGTLGATKITQKSGAIFEGQGDISGKVIIETDGLVRLTGPSNIFGDLQIDPNAMLEISDGTTLVKGHCTCSNGTIHMKGGYFIPQGGLSGDCNIIWEPGLYTNVADFNLDGQVNLKDFAYLANTWLWQSAWR